MRKTGVVCLLICSVIMLFFAVAKEPAASAASIISITDFYGEIELYNEAGDQIQHDCLSQNPISFEDSNIFMDAVKVILYPQQGKYYQYSLKEDRTDFVLITQTPTIIYNVEFLIVREAAVYGVTFCYPYGDANQDVVQFILGGGKVAPPQNPAPTDGCEFLGWKEADCIQLFDFETPINRNYTLYPAFSLPQQEPEAPVSYTVTFNVGAGKNIGGNISQTVLHGADAQPPQVQPPAGYTFAGWDKSTQNITADITINAIYQINHYIVTFDIGLGCALCNTPLLQSIQYGAAAQPPQVQPPAGYTFEGWDKSAQSITADTTINAIYQIKHYTVSFDIGAGCQVCTIPLLQTIQHGANANPPQIQPPTGYTFEGWDNSWQNIIADTNIKAEYSAIVCTIYFYINDDLFYTSDLAFASSISAPTSKALADYIPAGKYLDYWTKDGNTPYNFGTIEDEELRLYAVLGTHSYIVYFELGEGFIQGDISSIQQTIQHGQDAAPPQFLPPVGYTFTGWDVPYNSITANKTITAIYQKISCQVSFYYGSEPLCSFFVDYGSIIKEASAAAMGIALPQGYYLDGWTADNTALYNFSVGITSSICFEAVLKKYKYEIHFYDGDKLLLEDDYIIEVEHGDCLAGILPQAPQKANAVFECWLATPTSDRPYNCLLPITGAINLYAKYKALSYTIHSQVSGGITMQISDMYAQEGQEISFCYTLPEGYTIQSITLCWQQNEQVITGSSFVMPASDVTLKLEQSEQKYSVEVITESDTVHIPYGESYTPQPPQPPDHYIFEGWYTDSDCTTSFCGKCKADFGEPVRLYPKFAKRSYDITFIYGYGGTVSQTQSIEYGTYPIPPTPQQTDYLVFLGWDTPLTLAQADVEYNATYKVLFDICYYAEGALLLTTRAELSKDTEDIAPLKDGYDFVGFVIEDIDMAAHTARYNAVYTQKHPPQNTPVEEITTPNEENNLPQAEQQASQNHINDAQNDTFASNKWQLLLLLICGFVGVKVISAYITKKKSSVTI